MVHLADDELAGEALLWGIDSHNRSAHQAAGMSGFVREGILRRAAWVGGDFLDLVVLGLLDVEHLPTT